MKTKSKISAYIFRGSAAALLVSCVIVALCSAINLPNKRPKIPAPENNGASGASGHESAFSVSASPIARNRTLTFADRVAYQRAIEEVYWQHRIWPEANAGSKPPLDKVMSQADIEKKVTDYLGNSQALEAYWQRPLTADQLQAEMERMATNTKQPEVLQELFESLGNDPFVIAECLARPILTERLTGDLAVVAGVPPAPVVVATPLRGVARNVPQARGYSERHSAQLTVTMAASEQRELHASCNSWSLGWLYR